MDRVGLYAVAPDAFVEARNALVKELKAAGDKEEAAAVAKLRRPSATAWALNQLARTRPELVDRVCGAGDEFASAARTGTGIREAQAAVRASVEAAVDAAVALIDGAGHGTTDRTRQLLAGTLRASIGDADIAASLRAGVLAGDHEEFGLESLVDVPRVGRTPSPKPAPRPKAERTAVAPVTPAPVKKKPAPTIEAARAEAAEAGRARLVARAERLEAEAAQLLARAAELRRQASC